ncbi:MAG: hypothetical protein IJT72_08810 [Lachnospiraceae bacterium]|nr:hypothetical protein [Lachnospiraceae bacterium]
MGKLIKGLVTITAATAAVGGLCYVFKDQIKESKVYKEHNVDEKINKIKTSINENEKINKVKTSLQENETFNKVKNTIKEKMPKFSEKEEDYVDEGEIFFDDLDAAASDRDYVSLAGDEENKEDDAEASATEA